MNSKNNELNVNIPSNQDTPENESKNVALSKSGKEEEEKVEDNKEKTSPILRKKLDQGPAFSNKSNTDETF